MAKVDKEKRDTLKFIEENPQSSTDSKNICGFIVDDLFNNGLADGYRSNELGRGPEPLYYRLQITTKGREFLEANNFSSKVSAVLSNQYIVGVVCTVIGGFILAYLTMHYLT